MPAYQNVSVQFLAGLALVTTTETVALDSGRVAVSMPTMRAVVTFLGSVSYGTGTTSMTLRIRRGSGIGATQVLISQIPATASAQGDVSCGWSEQILNNDFAEYTVTLQQGAATGNANVVWALLRVDLING